MARKFMEETTSLRECGAHFGLVFDGYSGQILFETLIMLRYARVVVIDLPAHTSHTV